MKISIITATYNSSATISDCIRSVNEQTYDNIEHIIIDGASKDNTLEIIKNMPNRVAKIISESDKGIYDAMNKGVQIASGEIVGILNSDDILYSENTISNIVNAFQYFKPDGVFGNMQFVDFNDLNKVIRTWRGSPYSNGSFRKGWHPSHPTFYVKKNIYEKYGIYDNDMDVSADFELMLRFIEKYHIKTHYLNEFIVKMRYGGESTGSLKKILIGNRNVMRAFKKNGIKVSLLYPFYRLIPKLKQFLIK